MPPKLLLKYEAAVIKEIPITEDKTTITIGRKEDNDIVIDHPAVSGHHAKIIKSGGAYILEDLNSTNGTFIEDKKILKVELHNKIQIDFVKHSLVFIDEAETPVALSVAAPALPPSGVQQISGKTGCIRVVDGVVDKDEVLLSEINTYIGTKDTAGIKIKPAGGIFGGGAPLSVAVINRRPEGSYIIKALESNYPKVNNKPLKDTSELKDGDIIEAGKTKMVFFLKESS